MIGYPSRVAGVAYKNLSAHGFGEATDYQKTFGNYPLELGSLLKRLIGRRQQTKIQILRDFDGLVRSGEMLVGESQLLGVLVPLVAMSTSSCNILLHCPVALGVLHSRKYLKEGC